MAITKRTRQGKTLGGRSSAKAPKGLRARAGHKGRDWEKFRMMYKPLKMPVTVRLDADILDFFKRGGRGYQTRINRALRQIMEAKKGRR